VPVLAGAAGVVPGAPVFWFVAGAVVEPEPTVPVLAGAAGVVPGAPVFWFGAGVLLLLGTLLAGVDAVLSRAR
jgi:hypothetical protein